jgi:DNA repair protein RadC
MKTGLRALGLRDPRVDDRPQGFSEAAMRGLADLDARLPPPEAQTQPAFGASYQWRDKLSARAAAGGGLVTDVQGNARPHYWGHRQRLRTRFLDSSAKGMPDYELLELLLFNAIPRIDVKPLAKRLLAEFGDLNAVLAASERRLLKVHGTDKKVVYQLRLALAVAERLAQTKVLNRNVASSSQELIDYCRTAMAHRETEQFRILFLDRKNTVRADEEQAPGTVDHVPVYPREVAKRALELSASAIILVHNHPSGDTTPSDPDIVMTRKVADACEAISVVVHDHVIIGRNSEYSFRENGQL